MNQISLEDFQRTGAIGGRKGAISRRAAATCRALRREGRIAEAESIEAALFDGRPTPPTIHNAATRDKLRKIALKREAKKRAMKDEAASQ